VMLGIKLQQKGVSLRPRWHAMSAQLKRVIGNSFTLMLGNLLMAGTTVIGIAVASRLSTGSVSSLSYANKMTSLSAGLIASSLGTATISFFAKLSARGDWQELKSSLRHFLGLAFLLTCPITLFVMLFATPLTRLLFKRGAFATEDVAVVAELIFYLALQIPFYVTNVLIAKIFLALQTPRIILYGSAINLVVYAIFVSLLSEKLGLVGIAIATSVTYFCSFLVLFCFADRKLKRLLDQ
jgi:putative peptidoglycan lipid II flippase